MNIRAPARARTPEQFAALIALALAVTTYAYWPMIASYPGTPDGDGRFFYFQIGIAKSAMRIYHELPLWNAIDCKGAPLWDNPEAITGSPLLFLALGASATTTLYLWQGIHAAIGFFGAVLWLRDEQRLSRTATILGAALYAFAGCHAAQYGGAHETFVSFLDLPLLLILWRRSEHSTRAIAGFAMLLAFMVFEGATYPLPFTAVCLAAETLTRVWPLSRLKRVARAGAAGVLGAGLLSAPRLLPLLSQFARHPRQFEPDIDALTRARTLWEMFTLREIHWWYRLPGQQYVWGEYVCYIGTILLTLACVGAAISLRKNAALVAIAIVTIVFMLGHFGDFAPWALVRHVFPFSAMRVPSRFRLILILFIATFIGVAIDRTPVAAAPILGERRSRQLRAVLLLAAALGVGDVINFSRELLATRFTGPPAAKMVQSRNFYLGGADQAADFTDLPNQNRGWVGCRADSWAYHREAAVWEGDVPQVKATSDAAQVSATARTHNTFRAKVVSSEPTRILLNTAFDEGWRSNVGVVQQDAHLVAIDLPAGTSFVEAHYWPVNLTGGIVLFGFGTLYIAFLIRKKRFN